MKTILFLSTNRVHLSRQQILLNELRKYFQVTIFEPVDEGGGMAVASILYAVKLNNFLAENKVDCVLVRGDRYELLPMVAVAVYMGIKVIHIEGGDLSGVIDNKVRHAITHLSDYHFCTNEEAHTRLINMGCKVDNVFNFGSLDVEFASLVEPKKSGEKQYIFVAYHPINGEDEVELDNALANFPDYEIVSVSSNKDYGRQYGEDSYSPEDYINLMRNASCLVGNSSSLLKEASIMGVGVVNVGSRQSNRLKPHNVIDVPCEANRIRSAITYQLTNKYERDIIYSKQNTSKRITQEIMKILN